MKKDLLQFCWKQVDDRAARLKRQSDELHESLDSETKNTAGDKHETGRAMVQLEQEKLGQQLQEVDAIRAVLRKIDIDKQTDYIRLGSLVRTSMANYFVAISAGLFTSGQEKVYCISANAPIAQALWGKKKGDSFVFNGAEHSILEVICRFANRLPPFAFPVFPS